MSGPRRLGSIVGFDDHVGLGAAVDEAGTTFAFHCTQIADGSRSIPVGTPVDFAVAPAHGGRWEAVDVRRHGGGQGGGESAPVVTAPAGPWPG